MSDEQGGVNQVIVGLLERATNQIKLATDGATDEQLYYRPTTNANSIAWLVWHLEPVAGPHQFIPQRRRSGLVHGQVG